MENEKKSINNSSVFDKPKNVKRILYLLYGSCALLFALDFVIHRHVLHSWENLWGFYPLYGFVGCVVLVLVATWMRTFLMRSENYYDEDKADVDSENPGADKKPGTDINNADSGGHDVDA